MKIEFDPGKAAANPLKHEGVTFDEAKAVLLDPYAALTQENGHADNEHRFITLGMGAKGLILIVVWTLPEESVRLISTWKANHPPKETL